MKPSLHSRFGWLQAPVGGLGLVIWLGAFQGATWFRAHDLPILADLASGYVLGFGSAFAGWIAFHIWKGNTARFIDDNPFFKWVSIIMLSIIGLFGLAGVLIDLYGNTTGWFNTAFWVGGGVMGICTGPLIDDAEGL